MNYRNSNFRSHLEAKVYGLLNLASVIDHSDELRSNLDFFFIQSSLSTVLGGIGLAAYSAVNHFMNSFASVRNRQGKFPWITVDWDGWIFKDTSDSMSGLGKLSTSSITDLSMTPEEGLKRCKEKGLILTPGTIDSIRAVTHLDVNDDDIENAATIIDEVFK